MLLLRRAHNCIMLYSFGQVGFKTAVISGGFTHITDRVKEDLSLDYGFANTLEIKNGVLTGNVLVGIVNKERKRDLTLSIAQTERISSDQIVAIGDGCVLLCRPVCRPVCRPAGLLAEVCWHLSKPHEEASLQRHTFGRMVWVVRCGAVLLRWCGFG